MELFLTTSIIYQHQHRQVFSSSGAGTAAWVPVQGSVCTHSGLRQSWTRVTLNPRPAGVWIVTRPAGGGGQRAPPEISQTTGPISKFQTQFDSPVRELPVQGQKFDPEVTDDVTGQVKVRIFDFSDLVTSASNTSMLSANKANESA